MSKKEIDFRDEYLSIIEEYNYYKEKFGKLNDSLFELINNYFFDVDYKLYNPHSRNIQLEYLYTHEKIKLLLINNKSITFQFLDKLNKFLNQYNLRIIDAREVGNNERNNIVYDYEIELELISKK